MLDVSANHPFKSQIFSIQLTTKMDTFLSTKFKFLDRDTSLTQELRGGIATFLTMSYVLLVNPQLLSKVGVPANDAVIATALSAGIGSFIVGYFGSVTINV